jgi:hypothetical protein
MSEDYFHRIGALHAWYQINVLPMRLTPEVERLWFEWLKAGYNGPDLRDVIRYIRRQISLGKRNEGALKLSNLLARSESGFLKFDEDLALARARQNLRTDRRLDPVPEDMSPASATPGAPSSGPARPSRTEQPMSDKTRASFAAQLKALRTKI